MRKISIIGLTILGFTAACDGGDVCEGLEFSACGGELQGTWELQDTCGISETLFDEPAECTDATFETHERFDVVLEFGDDGTYEFTPSGTTSATYKISTDCLDALEITCDDYGDSFGDDGSCTLEDDCQCDVTTDASTIGNESGTYAVDGTTLTTTPNDDAPDEVEYCVDGDTLTIATPSEDDIILVFKRR